MITPLLLFSLGLAAPAGVVGSSFLADRFAKNHFSMITLAAGLVITGLVFTAVLLPLSLTAAVLLAYPSALITIGILYHDRFIKNY